MFGRIIPENDKLEPAATAEPALDAPLTPAREAAEAGGWMARAALFLALGWIAAVITVTAALVGLGALGAMTFLQGAALTFTALLPAALLLFAGATAREGARAQAQARRLADAADRMMNPSPVAEAAARRLGISVRGEIAALDRSLAETLAKLAAVESVIARQTDAVDKAAATAQQGAGAMVNGLERERAILVQISSDLDAGVARLGATIQRQSAAISGAAHEAETQLRAVDQVLEGRLNTFGVAAQMIGERTGLLTHAAASTADSTQHLESALSGALDMLAQATSLTEAAKKSTDAATHAANTTAGAVRETTNRAIDDARRVAELIRQEAQTVEREAAMALERLREAAEAAREAAAGAREVIGAPPPPRRPNRTGPFTFIQGGKDRRAESRREADRLDAQRFDEQVARVAALPEEQRRRSFGEHFGFGPRIQARGDGRVTLEDKVNAERGNADRWSWRDMLRAIEPEVGQPQAREAVGRPLVSAAPNEYEAPRRAAADPAMAARTPVAAPTPPPAMAPVAPPLRSPSMSQPMGPVGPRPAAQTFSLYASAPAGAAMAPRAAADPLFERPAPAPGRVTQMMETIGVRLNEVFSVAALDRIGARARNGTQARRRAVRDAAPEAVLRLAERFDTDPRAREEAGRFLESEGARIADLLGRGRASMGADATRAFLLIDAASS